LHSFQIYFNIIFQVKKLELLPHTQLSKQTAARKQDYEEIQSILEKQKAVAVIHLNNYKLNTAMKY